jgi:hypothetical protein
MAGSVADVLDRRTRASLRDARGAAGSAGAAAELIGAELGWDSGRIRREGEEYAARVHTVLQRAGLPDSVPDPANADATGSATTTGPPVSVAGGEPGSG